MIKIRIVVWDGFYWAEFLIGHHEIGFEMWCRWMRPYRSQEVLEQDLGLAKINSAATAPGRSDEYSPDRIVKEIPILTELKNAT